MWGYVSGQRARMTSRNSSRRDWSTSSSGRSVETHLLSTSNGYGPAGPRPDRLKSAGGTTLGGYQYQSQAHPLAHPYDSQPISTQLTSALADCRTATSAYSGAQYGLQGTELSKEPTSVPSGNTHLETLVGDVVQILKRVEHLAKASVNSSVHGYGHAYDWHRVSVMLDRIFFVFYVALIGVSLTVLFPRPH